MEAIQLWIWSSTKKKVQMIGWRKRYQVWRRLFLKRLKGWCVFTGACICSWKLYSAGWQDVSDHNITQLMHKPNRIQELCVSLLFSFRITISIVYDPSGFSFLGWYVCNDRLFMSTSLYQTTSLSFHLWVYTHGQGVHKAASGACCYVAQSQGPKHGIAPLVCHCRYPHIHWCCTSGTDKSLPHRYGLRWLVWEGCRAEDTQRHWKYVLCSSSLVFLLEDLGLNW